MGLKLKVSLFLAFITAAAMLCAATVGYYFAKQQAIHAAHTEMQSSLLVRSAQLENWLNSKIHILETTGALLRDTVNDDAITAAHLQVYRLDPDMTNLHLGLADGRYFSSSDAPPPPAYDPRQQPWYQQAAEKVSLQLTAPYIDALSQRDMVSLVLPLHTSSGTLRGVIAAEVQLSVLTDFMRQTTLNNMGYSFILDKDGICIAHPDPHLRNTPLQNQPGFAAITPALLENQAGSTSLVIGDTPFLLAYQKMAATGWTIVLAVPEAAFYQELADMKWHFTLLTAVVIALVIVLTLLLSRRYIVPLVVLARQALQIARGNLTVDIGDTPAARNDEFGHFIASFKEMLHHVRNREQHRIQQLESSAAELVAANQQLSAANAELNQAMDTLQKTQHHLIQSEKMAALGSLVAGVAHEINTPVGVGVTAASHLQQLTDEFQRRYQTTPLTKRSLEDFLENTHEAAAIILTNLERASHLTRNLKQVSVDQSSEARRSFAVKEYIDKVLLSLHPQLKTSKHIVTVDCPEDLIMDAYPGAFGQILTNLIMNSLLHAYEPDESGHMHIFVSRGQDTLTLQYRDDGKGMEPQTAARIYEPFFTTKRNAGGTGLGLYILYNMIQQQFAGTISCESEIGVGTKFIITLPLVAPQR